MHCLLQKPERSIIVHDAAIAIGAVAMATAVAWAAQHWLGLFDLSMVFIVAVVLVASRTRMLTASIAAALCFLSYNFFFIAPQFTFYIHARRDLVAASLFLVAAVVAGRLASRLRVRVEALREAIARTNVLQALDRELASATNLDAVLLVGCATLRRCCDADVVVQAGDLASRSDGAPEWNVHDRSVVDAAQRDRVAAGRFIDAGSGSQWSFFPLGYDDDGCGVMALRFPVKLPQLPFETRELIEAIGNDIGHSIQRTRLVADLEDARVTNETERLRSALLSSVSHDLRSPLAAIIGAASSLDHYGGAMSAADRHSLLETIRIEGERLDRYIQNLLDMTRLGHRGLALRRDWIGIDELIGSAVMRLQRYQPKARFIITVAPDMPPIWVHPALVEQALFNVLENAVRFSPSDASVAIHAMPIEGGTQIDIIDHGPGIPEDERRRIFDMFYSVERGDSGRKGTGLGLSICQGMVGAHGGSVEALPGADGCGTLIRITLPRIEPITDVAAISA